MGDQAIQASAEIALEMRKKIALAELEFIMRDIENKLHLFSHICPTKEIAVKANAMFSAPLMRLRQTFGMASSKVIKIGRRAA